MYLLSEFYSEKGKFDQAIAPEQPTSSNAPPQPIPTLTISQPATMTPKIINHNADQKAVYGKEPRHIKTTTKEFKEEVTELVPVTDHNKKDAEHVKMVVSANAGGKDVNKDVNKDVIPNAGSVATVTLEGGEVVYKDIITNADSVNNKPALGMTSLYTSFPPAWALTTIFTCSASFFLFSVTGTSSVISSSISFVVVVICFFSSPETAFWTAVSLLFLGVMVAGCDIVRVGMGWGGALLDVGCSGAIAWSNFLFSKENSDSEYTVPIDQNSIYILFERRKKRRK